MKKFDRVIATLVMLQTRKVVTAASIAERFDVSLRTVYRDVATLKNAGVPIIGDPGIGYSIIDGYRIAPIAFNEGEAASLLTAEKFIGRHTDQETKAYYSSAMMKIRAILRSSEKQALSILEESIAITARPEQEKSDYLQDIFKSISAKYTMDLQYEKQDGTSSTRIVEPIGCYHRLNKWYLIAYCQLKSAYRTFKVERITGLRRLQKNFDREHVSLQAYIDKQEAAWKRQQEHVTIQVAFTPKYLKFVELRKQYFGFVSEKMKGEETIMTFNNSSVEVFARWLLQFGNQARVLAPDQLKNKLKALSQELFKHHD